jgi:membrane-associated protease RseP (regulator of RpoE activity)
MLKEIPAGRKVSMEFSRDGNLQTISVELADRRVMEHDVWKKLDNNGDVFAQSPGMGVLAGGGDNALPGMFHMPIFVSTLNVGAIVEPLSGQLAEYLGIPGGLVIRQVAHKSEAATAGFKPKDVILKVGTEPVVTVSDWDRALRLNEGRPVQVTILRENKQQTLTLQVDSKHKSGELEIEELFPDGSCPLVAELDPEAVKAFAQQTADAAKELKDRIQGMVNGEISAQEAGQFRKQAEELRDQLKLDKFKLDQKQMDELKKQMEDFRKSFKPEDFKIDPKQMDELKRQMEQFRMDFQPQDLELSPNYN